MRERVAIAVLVSLMLAFYSCGEPSRPAGELTETSPSPAGSGPEASSLASSGPRASNSPTPEPETGTWTKKYEEMTVELRVTPTDARSDTVIHFAMRATGPSKYRVTGAEWNPGIEGAKGWVLKNGLKPCPQSGDTQREPLDARWTAESQQNPPPGDYRPRFTVYTQTCQPDGSHSPGPHGPVEGEARVHE
jgi:hypothetical protein